MPNCADGINPKIKPAMRRLESYIFQGRLKSCEIRNSGKNPRRRATARREKKWKFFKTTAGGPYINNQ